MDEQSPWARPIQEAVSRDTEGNHPAGANLQEKATGTKRQRGRPKGSRNKAKSLIPSELANQLLLVMKDELPPDHYEYMRRVVREGGAVSVQREVQIMLFILGRNLFPVLMEEIRPDDEESGFRKDVTERLKVWNSLAGILNQIEKSSEGESDTSQKPILQVFERSRVDPARIRILLGVESSSLGGSPDGVRGTEITVGALSGELSDGPFDIQNSEQVEATGVLDNTIDRDDAQRMREEEL